MECTENMYQRLGRMCLYTATHYGAYDSTRTAELPANATYE